MQLKRHAWEFDLQIHKLLMHKKNLDGKLVRYDKRTKKCMSNFLYASLHVYKNMEKVATSNK